jgi:hypothetical protein
VETAWSIGTTRAGTAITHKFLAQVLQAQQAIIIGVASVKVFQDVALVAVPVARPALEVILGIPGLVREGVELHTVALGARPIRFPVALVM